MRMLYEDSDLSKIRNRLGHENIQSTLTDDPRIKELMDWENEEETLVWLDSL